jgi:hypothetical protein
VDTYRFGTLAGADAPGGIICIGLMGKLTTPGGAAPDGVLLAVGQMDAGKWCAPAAYPCELLVHILSGATTAMVADESAHLIADMTVRIPQDTTFQLSTRDTTGMAALIAAPLRESFSWTEERTQLSACFADGLSLSGEPQRMDWSSLDILGALTRLTSEGSVIVMPTMTRGNYHRDLVLATLLPHYAADPNKLHALVWAINAHPQAHWWLDYTRAQERIVEEMGALLTR